MTTTTIRLDNETKDNARELARSLGIPLNALINALLKKAIKEGGVDLRQNPSSKVMPQFRWSGGLKELKSDFDSVSLQHAVKDWRNI